MPITKRLTKGSELTHQEVDENFDYLDRKKADKESLAAVATSGAYADLTGRPENISAFNNDKDYRSGNQVDVAITQAVSSKVPQTRTINGKNLTADIVISAGDLELAEVATSGSYNDLEDLPEVLTPSSLNVFDGVSDGETLNDAAFLAAEDSPTESFYMPEGIYKTSLNNLSKRYVGPGVIVFGDGYVQNCAVSTAESPRSKTGPLAISSATDILLNPVGTTNANGRRITGLGKAVSQTDAMSASDLLSGIAKGIKFSNEASADKNTLDWFEEGEWVPKIVGWGSPAGTATYAAQYGRFTRIGNQVRIEAIVDFTITGLNTNQAVVLTGIPYKGITKAAGPHMMHAGIGTGSVERQDFTGTCWFYVDEWGVVLLSTASGQQGVLPGDHSALWHIDITYTAAE